MVRRGKQLPLFTEKLDAPLVKAADRYIELAAEKKKHAERLDVSSRNLLGLMKKAGKARIRHGGFEIAVKEGKPKESISLKPEKVQTRREA